MDQMTVTVTIKKRKVASKFSSRNVTANNSVSANRVPRLLDLSHLPKPPLLTRSFSVFTNKRTTADGHQLDDDDDVDEDNTIPGANTFKVVGQKMTPRSPDGENCPQWRKLLTHQRSDSRRLDDATGKTQSQKRRQRQYLGLTCKEQEQPYSWNYTLLPVKVLEVQNRSAVHTPRSLSEAIRTYAVTTPKKPADHCHENPRTTKTTPTTMSPWTREWLQQSQRSLMRDNATPLFPQNHFAVKNNEADTMVLEHARTRLAMSHRPQNGRVPANTPLSQTILEKTFSCHH